MNNSEKAQNEMIEKAIKEGSTELIVKTGTVDAVSNPLNIKIEGSIDSPSRFLIKRESTFNKLESHAIVNNDKKSISLVVNETNSNGKRFAIIGTLEESEIFQKLGINSTCSSYTPVELANRLKLMRNIFPKISDHAMIVSTLRNIKAKINKEIEDLNDQKGNVTKHFEQSVESNMPDSFEIEIPLLKGEPKQRFSVNVILEARGHEIICYLESIDAAEIIERIAEERIAEEVEKIDSLTTVIFQ